VTAVRSAVSPVVVGRDAATGDAGDAAACHGHGHGHGSRGRQRDLVLEVLNLSGCRRLGGETLVLLLRCCPKLRDLNLGYCCNEEVAAATAAAAADPTMPATTARVITSSDVEQLRTARCVSWPFPSVAPAVLTEISLCHACSCQEINIESGNGAAGAEAGVPEAGRYGAAAGGRLADGGGGCLWRERGRRPHLGSGRFG
jgi:hypothetical protein